MHRLNKKILKDALLFLAVFEGRSDPVCGSMVICGPYFYSGTLTHFLYQIVLFAFCWSPDQLHPCSIVPLRTLVSRNSQSSKIITTICKNDKQSTEGTCRPILCYHYFTTRDKQSE